jgi:hypothetical protein
LDAFVTLEAGERTVSLRLEGGRPTSVSVTVLPTPEADDSARDLAE